MTVAPRFISAATRWRSPIMWWTIWRGALVYLVARITLTMSLAWAGAPFLGFDTALSAVLLAVVLVRVDARLSTSPLLLYNAGISDLERVLASLPFAVLSEAAILGASLA